MATYRFYTVEDGHSVGVPLVIDCEDGAEAIEKAKEHVIKDLARGQSIEICNLERRVALIERTPKP